MDLLVKRHAFLLGLFSTAFISLGLSRSYAGYDHHESFKDGPPPQAGYVWEGAYVGLGAGLSSLNRNIRVNGNSTQNNEQRQRECDEFDIEAGCFSLTPWSAWAPVGGPITNSVRSKFSDDDTNGFGTIQVGYDRLVRDKFLVGVFGDFDFFPDAGPVENVWSIGGRFGVLVTPRILVYGIGGYSAARLERGLINAAFGANALTLATPDELHGWFIGGGGEVKLRPRVSLKIEYRYSDFGDNSSSARNTSSAGPTCTQFAFGTCVTQSRSFSEFDAVAGFDTHLQSVRAVLVFKLGDRERHVHEPLK